MIQRSQNTDVSDIVSNSLSHGQFFDSQPLHKVFQRSLNRLNVSQKIGFGYAVAISIAVCGSMSGILISNHYRIQANEKQEHAHKQVEMVQKLQDSILQLRIHQQQLIPLLNQPEKFKDEYSHFLEHAATLRYNWSNIKYFIFNSYKTYQNHSSVVVADRIPKLLKTYRGVPEAYLEEIGKILQQIDSLNLDSPEKITTAQKVLLDFTNNSLALKFDAISDDLVGLLKVSDANYLVAEKALKHADKIHFWVTSGSILLSTMLAILFAYYISISISHPLKNLTYLAQEVTQESNFELQASVTTADEIGVLATSFNQMILKVKQLLAEQIDANHKLESYNDSLEEKVEKRSQELIDKNSILENTLKELKKTQGQLIQTEKMSSLGQLVAGVAHEINNPVNFIHGNIRHAREYAEDLLRLVELYQAEYPNPSVTIQEEVESIDLDFMREDLPKLLSSMKVGSERIREIVKSLRNFSRLDEAEYKPANIHEGIDSTLMILQNRLKAKSDTAGIEIIKEYGELPLVECYPGQLNQVFMNLLTNAIDALDEHNQKTISFEEIKTKPSQIRISTQVLDSESITICIADNGPGISPEIVSQLFDPFFTTKAVGKGTGLGLAISYNIIVEKHHGDLKWVSQLSEGTEFMIRIPIAQKNVS